MGLFNNMKFPAWTMQQLNLDWILQEIKRVLGFFPESGNSGTVLMKTDDGTAWEELEAVDININGVPEDTELTDTDKLIFYDISSSANRKITAPNLLNSMMSNGTPLMDGTGSAGTSKKPARYDHRHPTDTTRAPMSYFTNDALQISHGGTGGGTAHNARVNLSVYPFYELPAMASGQSAKENIVNIIKAVRTKMLSENDNECGFRCVITGSTEFTGIASKWDGGNVIVGIITGPVASYRFRIRETDDNYTIAQFTETVLE